jgi:hypothetical protein
MLNESLNTTGTVTIYDIVPDDNGEAIITIAPGTPTSQLGLMGALIMQAYTPSANAAPVAPTSLVAGGSSNGIAAATIQEKVQPATVTAYPNHFAQYFNLNIWSNDDDKIIVSVYSINGRAVYQNQFAVSKGNNNIIIKPQGMLAAGEYFVKINYKNGEQKALKMIKQ